MVDKHMILTERYYDLNVIQELKKIQEPIEGLIDPGVLKQISYMSDRKTRQVKYYRHTLENGKEYGRYYAPKGCIQPIKGEIRNLVLNDSAYEVDMRNAHPTIMYQMAKKFGVELPGIENYVIHRGKILQEVQELYKVDKDQSKELFIRVMFGGKLQTWLKDNEIEETEHHQSILDFEEDINILKGVLASKIPDWEAYKKEAVKQDDVERKEYDKNKNRRKKKKVPVNSALAYTLQTIEATIMVDVLKCLQDKKYKTIALVHDGIYVWRDKKQLPDLAEISKLVKDNHGYDLIFDIKTTLPSSDDRFWLEQVKQHITEDDGDIYEQLDSLQVSNEIDPAFFDKINELLPITKAKYSIRKDYRGGAEYARECISRVKDYLKDKVYYMKQDGSEFYIEVGRNCFGDIIKRNQVCISKLNNNSELGLWTRHGSSNWVESIHELNLIERRFRFGYTDDPGVLNIYRRPAIMERHPEPATADLSIFHVLVKNICGEDPVSIEYFLNYFAFVLQKRIERSQMVLLIYGDMGGAGKTSIVLELIGNKIMGHDYIKIGSKKDLTGNHSSHTYEGKRLIVLEEVSFSGDKELNAELNDITTRSEMLVNPKHKTPYIAPDRSCFVALSNSLTPISIGNRRIFAITPKRPLTTEESTSFYTWIEDDKNVRAVYQFFLDRDISNYSPFRDVPTTDSKKDLIESNNRWFDLIEFLKTDYKMYYMIPNYDPVSGKRCYASKEEGEYNREWYKITPRIRLSHFRDYIAPVFCKDRSLGLKFKSSTELGNEIQRTLGAKVSIQRNHWRKADDGNSWICDDEPGKCIDFEPLFTK